MAVHYRDDEQLILVVEDLRRSNFEVWQLFMTLLGRRVEACSVAMIESANDPNNLLVLKGRAQEASWFFQLVRDAPKHHEKIQNKGK